MLDSAGSVMSDFNPRLREGGDIIYAPVFEEHTISIHASAKEATRISGHIRISKVISIHASAKEATIFELGALMV